MKRTFIIAVLSVLFTSIATAQNLKDKVYFDEKWNIISDASKASYYRLYNASDRSDGLKPYQDFYLDGKLQGEGFYSRIENNDGTIDFIEEGEQKSYDENGKLNGKWYKKNGKMDGENITYYESGMKQWVSVYKDGIRQKSTKYDDSTGTIDRVLTYKNGKLDGKQIQYDPNTGKNVWKEEFFKDGLMQKEITYTDDGKIRKIFTLISRQDTTFIANETWYLREDEDSLTSKFSVDKIYDFTPEIWEYAFQIFYVETADFGGAISENHGKYQKIDRQGRILTDGEYYYGEKTGKWTNYLYSQNCYYIDDYDNEKATRQYYQLNNKLFSGHLTISEPADGKTELNIKNGIHTGPYTVYRYNDGELIMKYFGNFDENSKDDGYFHAELEIDGEWKTVDYSNYKHGVKHGEWRTIDGDSIIFKNYNNGELDGEYQIRIVNSREDYALPKDSIWHCITRGAYKNGLRTGHWWQITDSRFEQNQKEGDYIDGKAEGEWIFYEPYSPDGYLVMRQIDAIINFHNGMKEGKATIFKDKSNAPFKDSVDIIAYFKNDELDGSYEKHDNDGNIIEKGNNANGNRIGEWAFTYYDENCYKIINYDNKPTTARFYTLNGKPFSGTHSEPYEKEYDDDPDTVVFTIKKSYIQQVDFIDSESKKVLQTSKFKNGLPKEE